MALLKIHLQFNPDDFREIFYKNDQHLIHKNRKSKPIFYWAVVIFILFVISLIISRFSFGKMTQFLFLAALISEGVLLSEYFTLRRWRKNVEHYITTVEGRLPYELTISDPGFELSEKIQSEFENWNQVVTYRIYEDHIDIHTSSSHYLFPKKSMTENEYSQFKELLKRNVLEMKGSQTSDH